MTGRLLYFFLLLLFLSDTGYSFFQFYNQPLDGDMAVCIVPANDFKMTLGSPLGLNAILKNQKYPNPNRFFSHWFYKEYFNSAPVFLQNFVKPIDSVYLSCAISKIMIQVILITLLAMTISGTANVLKLDFILAAVLITPLFQTNGYRAMQIIDNATTYTFFYALPCSFLLLYFLPFIHQFYHLKKLSMLLFIKILWIPLALVICLSGPLNPGVVLIFSILIILINVGNNFKRSNQEGIIRNAGRAIRMIPNSYWFYTLPVSIFALYSLYLGNYNSSSIQASLIDLYSRIPIGIYYQFTQKIGFPLLFAILALNMFVISIKFKTNEAKKILKVFKWIGLFALIYILLLPLGGYRNYRPNVLRYDTIMPITLTLIFIFGISTLFLLKNMTKKQRIWYIPLIIGILLAYVNSDEANFHENKCERIALFEISESKDKIVQIHNDCSILYWGRIIRPEDSELNAQLMYIWRITDKQKLYFNK